MARGEIGNRSKYRNVKSSSSCVLLADKREPVFSPKNLFPITNTWAKSLEALTEEEYKIRKKIPANNNYMFAMKQIPGDLVFAIDPTNYGNMMRFCNHSCDANIGFFVWTVNDTEILKMETVRDIQAVSSVLCD